MRILLAVPGILVNKTGYDKRTSLQEAAQCGHAEVVSILVGVDDIDLKAKRGGGGKTALDFAKDKGRQEVVAILEEAIATQTARDGACKAILDAQGLETWPS